MFVFAISLMLAVCDLGEYFSAKSAWEESAVDFAVDHASDGFAFASQKRDAVNCLLRGGSTWHGIEAYESRIYYGPEGAKRVEISLYNRGDDKSGVPMNEDDLAALLKEVASKIEPGGKIGRPGHKKLKTGGLAYVRSWKDRDPAVELAWGVSGSNPKKRTVEYVRIVLVPRAASKSAAAQKPVSGAEARAKAKARVAKNSDGDVLIRDVPMVDQGDKGYCAVATAERVMRYYGNTVDEHELAQMAKSTATEGTSLSAMIETVRLVGSKHRLGYSEIVRMVSSADDVMKEIEAYNKAAKSEKAEPISLEDFMRDNMVDVGAMRAAMKPKVLKKMRVKDSRYRKFVSEVKSQIDGGVPVFWGVTLGIFPEPGLPQASGGHIRLIIGYNAARKEILYTDSWGAGHELKRMPEDWAFAITHSAFYLKPL